MSPNEIIERLHREQFVRRYIAKIATDREADYLDDIEQDVYLQIASLSPVRMGEVYERDGWDGIRYYVTGIIKQEMRGRRRTTGAARYIRQAKNIILVPDYNDCTEGDNEASSSVRALSYLSERDTEIVQALIKHRYYKKAAEKLGMGIDEYRREVSRIRAKMRRKKWLIDHGKRNIHY